MSKGHHDVHVFVGAPILINKTVRLKTNNYANVSQQLFVLMLICLRKQFLNLMQISTSTFINIPKYRWALCWPRNAIIELRKVMDFWTLTHQSADILIYTVDFCYQTIDSQSHEATTWITI